MINIILDTFFSIFYYSNSNLSYVNNVEEFDGINASDSNEEYDL